jgi:hypothetical protein
MDIPARSRPENRIAPMIGTSLVVAGGSSAP